MTYHNFASSAFDDTPRPCSYIRATQFIARGCPILAAIYDSNSTYAHGISKESLESHT